MLTHIYGAVFYVIIICFYCILIVHAKFFMFTLFLLYLVRNDNNKDDQSINQ